jgi:Tfp pilus assembly protein PilV
VNRRLKALAAASPRRALRRSRARHPLRERRTTSESGFALFEVLIAIVVLSIGLAGLLGLLDTSAKASRHTRAREGATSLAREIIEDARAIPYAQLAPYSIVNQLQEMNGLANTTPGATWHIARRGVTYTVTVSECTIDDPKDGYGVHDSTYCPDSSQTGTADATPADLKRVTVEVAWTVVSRTSTVRQVETLTAAGESVGLSARELKLTSTTPAVKEFGSATEPVITEAVEKLTFSASAPSGTTAIRWSLDGTTQSAPATHESGTAWTFTWQPITGLSDGNYDVSAAAVDATGVTGPPVSISVRLLRSAPAAPKGFKGAFNTVNAGGVPTKVVELDWQANSERNVIGYRVFKGDGSEACPGGGELSLRVSCIDFKPPLPSGSAAERTYSVAALYRDSSGAVREGAAALFTVASGVPTGPTAPTNLTLKKNADGSTTLTWSAPSGGEAVSFYRVYRGSTDYTSRYDTATSTTYTDTDAVTAHQYWVTATTANLTESPFAGPVSG